MFIIYKKRIKIIFGCILLGVLAFTFQVADMNKFKEKNSMNAVVTTATPVSGKTVVLDAGHGKPDEGAQSSRRYY